MNIAIMQPYFFPYIGYFQLMNSVDEFVVYDNIEFTKKGWINRNRILVNGTDAYITVPLKKDSDFLNISQRSLADSWKTDRKTILNRISNSYRKAAFFDLAYPVVEKSILFEDFNLFNFILNSLSNVKDYLQIKTSVVISSSVSIDHTLKSEEKVIAICKHRNCDSYVNPIGGKELYKNEHFRKNGIELNFLKTGEVKYRQFENDFVPFLSIIDLMMFNSPEEIIKMLEKYTLE